MNYKDEGVRELEFSWRRPFFVWEEEILASLMVDLEGHVWNLGLDGWGWKPEEDGVFSVKSMYKKLEAMYI
jgi:hypothetical protein